ncbi:hypothetical protein [Lacrimispora sp.]|jgi:lipoprotein NlpI|uniref:hypothetical protein n=1 Tax=Lacrimispora sp. TaxID=2719234 RepID=UPI00289804E2|nr:hypothetical protein [Lacrimispora sp.]
MKELAISESKKELNALCTSVRSLALAGEYRECERLISDAIGKYPHAAEPHNLFGVILEKEGDHIAAMKHFRAAWALDPSYLPARQNLDSFGTFFSRGRTAYDESDCPEEYPVDYTKESGVQSIGYADRRKWI